MNWRRLIIGVLAVGLLTAGGLWGYSQFLAPETDDETAVTDPDLVSVDTGIDLVSAEGIVLPLADAQLSFLSGGQIVEILVDEGDQVVVNEPLIRLDSVDQEIGVIQAEAAVSQAQANVVTAEAGLLAAQTGLEAAQVGVAAAQAQLALTQAGPSDAQVVLSEKGIAVAEASIIQAAGSRDVTLDVSSAAISSAEATLRAAQAQYDDALKSFQPILQNDDITDEDVIEQATLQLNAAQANLASAQAALDEVLAGATRGERTAATAGVQVAVNQRDAAQAQLDLLLAGAKPEQVAIAEAGVEQAETAVSEAEVRIVQAESALAQANSAVVEAQAALTAAQSALDNRTLTAPFAGTVAAIPVKIGQVVSPGFPVLIVADMSGWQIETTDLTELSVVSLQRDFEVEVSVDAFPGETFMGTVADIATTSVESRGDVTYAVTIALEDGLDVPLRWGMTAFVTVDTDQ